MAKGTKSATKVRPSLTPEAREARLIALAMDNAERKLLDGSASSQLITHFLKLGSHKEEMEQEKLKGEIKLLEAKVERLQSEQKTEEMFRDAINAMKRYSGNTNEEYDEDV